MRLVGRLQAASLALAFALPSLALAQRGGRSSGSQSGHLSTLIGIVIDSIHGGTLNGATVLLDGTTVSAVTDENGKFRMDSIPPGDYRVAVFHPFLDTLGLAIGTPALRFGPDSIRQIVLGTPSAQTFVTQACPPLKRRLGPTAIMGRVTNPDTDAPMDSTRVSIVWTSMDVGKDIGVRRTQTVRESITDASGMYLICGLPAGIHGTIQAERNKTKTAEVEVQTGQAPLSFQSLTLLPLAANDTNPLLGEAVLSGRVTDQTGLVVADAKITVQGARNTGSTGKDGEFRISGLPSGTRGVIVRKIGYLPEELAVDLSSKNAARVAVRLEKAKPSLDVVKVEGAYETALKKNGFTDRRRMGMGHYLTAKDVATRQPQYFSDLFQMIPGFRVEPSTGGNNIVATHGGSGCVTYWIDGVQFRPSQGGELDTYVRPEQILAVETYSSAAAPMEFKGLGQSSCSVVVVWTNRTIRENPQQK